MSLVEIVGPLLEWVLALASSRHVAGFVFLCPLASKCRGSQSRQLSLEVINMPFLHLRWNAGTVLEHNCVRM